MRYAQMITPRAVTVCRSALVLPLIVTVAACAPDHPRWRPVATLSADYATLRDELPWRFEPCLVGTHSCLDRDPQSWRPCLVSTDRCSPDARIEPVGKVPR
jgi:hypothetical protein